jgi:hypothetical protein
MIHRFLGEKKGPLRVYGWHATKIDDQTFLVAYTYDEGPGSQINGWAFEYNSKAGIARNVTGDPDLQKEYARFGW